MAKKSAIKPDAQYRVILVKAVRVGRRQVLPGARVVMRGDALKAQIEADPAAITAYTELEA